jgi:hypothetical protein
MSLARDAKRVSDERELEEATVAPESSLPSSSCEVNRQLEDPVEDVKDILGNVE